MGIHIYGFRAPDRTWKKMKAVWDACNLAGVAPPEEVDDFFGGEGPDPRGIEVELESCPAVSSYYVEMVDGLEVDLDKLREAYPQLTHLRFCMRY